VPTWFKTGFILDNFSGNDAKAKYLEFVADMLKQKGVSPLNSDKSTAGQWRLPTKEELQRRQQNRSGFNNVQAPPYWSSSSYTNDTYDAWYVCMYYGGVSYYSKRNYYYVWPVRAGQ